MAAGWDGRAHLSKALWIGLAVDERGNEVGEAFAVMRLDFAWWGCSVGGPCRSLPLCASLACLAALVGRAAGRRAALRSLDRHVTLISVWCLCSCYVFIFTSPPRTCTALPSKLSPSSAAYSNPHALARPIVPQPERRSGDTISHDPTSTGHQRR